MKTISGPAKLGTGIPFRTQFHGEDHVTGADVPLSDIALTADEFNTFMADEHAHRDLFAGANSSNGNVAQPRWPWLKLVFPEKIEAAHVRITLHAGPKKAREIDLGVCKLAKIVLELKAGGVVELSCSVQTTPALDSRIGSLLSHMDSGVNVRIEYEHNAEQQELPVETEQPDAHAGNGAARRPHAASRKPPAKRTPARAEA